MSFSTRIHFDDVETGASGEVYWATAECGFGQLTSRATSLRMRSFERRLTRMSRRQSPRSLLFACIGFHRRGTGQRAGGGSQGREGSRNGAARPDGRSRAEWRRGHPGRHRQRGFPLRRRKRSRCEEKRIAWQEGAERRRMGRWPEAAQETPREPAQVPK